MKRVLSGFLVAGVVLTAVVLSGSQKRAESTTRIQGELDIEVAEKNPWTHLRLPNTPEVFHFAVVSDRTGAPRRGVFAKAVAQLNLLQPAFVLSVGDLIGGFTDKEPEVAEQWREFESLVDKLKMPFFYVPGNHDLANSMQEAHWRKRFGRRYYHFVYRQVLFLMLNADDPPDNGGGLGRNQIAYVRRVLKENDKVRWTIVALHRPLWDYDTVTSNGWLQVESALQGRPYTVFAGHMHTYRKFVRHGMNYYQLATTGGDSPLRGVQHGEFDHLVWVTMSQDGPVLANLMLDGILPENLQWNESK
jgi:hypothetical protein